MKKLLIILALLAIATPASAKLEITDTGHNEAAIAQAQKDYATILKVFKALTNGAEPHEMKMIILPRRPYRFELQKKGLKEEFMPESLLADNGVFLIEVTNKRGLIAHELLHCFAYSFKSADTKEEFLCAATQFLIDGVNINNDLTLSGNLKKDKDHAKTV